MDKREIEWLSGRDTGLSSEAIFYRLNGADGEHYFAYPQDPDDLGRCIRLLDLIPEYRARLGEMREVDPVWAMLVDHWQELEAVYREEVPDHRGHAPRCYARMRELIDPLTYRLESNEDAD